MIRALVLYGFIAIPLPVAGIILGLWVLDGFHAADATAAPEMSRWSDICVPGNLPGEAWARRGCLYYLSGFGMYYLGLALAVATLLTTTILVAAATWTGRDPFRMARCFGWVSGLFVTVWAALSIPRFLVISGLTVLLYHWMRNQAMADWIPKVVIVAIIGPSLVMAFSQVGALFHYWRRTPPSGSLGCVVDRAEAPELYDFVEDIARRVGMAAPAWLAVTADTDFSVTDGPVLLPDMPEPLEGGCMSLSLPLLRVLTSEEVAGIIAHELGHLDDPAPWTSSPPRTGPSNPSARFWPWRFVLEYIKSPTGPNDPPRITAAPQNLGSDMSRGSLPLVTSEACCARAPAPVIAMASQAK